MSLRVTCGAAVGAALVAAAVVAVYLTGLGEPVGNGDEAIYAEFIRSMHETGNYWTLAYQGVEVLQRPPTAVTIYALLSAVIPGEFGMRLGAVLCSVAGFFVVGAFVWRRTGCRSAGCVAVFVAAGTPTVYCYGRLAFSDPPFILAVSFALIATLAARENAKWLPWAAASLGAAFAVKSFAAAIPGLILGPSLLLAAYHHGRAAIRTTVLAVVAFVGTAGPYYIASLLAHGDRFVQEHIGRTLTARAAGDLGSVVGIGGPGAYLEHVWSVDGIVFSCVFLLALVGAVIDSRCRPRTCSGQLTAVVYVCVTLLALSVIGTRLRHYMLVVYPGLALCAGYAAAWGVRRARHRLAAPIAVAAAALCFVVGIAREPFDSAVAPAYGAARVGDTLQRVDSAGTRVYTLDWYAPAVGYYAARQWHLLATPPDLARALKKIDPFRYAHNIHLAPPWPPPSSVVALDAAVLPTLQRRGFVVHEVLAREADYVIVRGGSR